jgi:hypothetical protein
MFIPSSIDKEGPAGAISPPENNHPFGTPDPWVGDTVRCAILPPDLDTREPGAELARYLTSLDRSRVSGRDLVTVMRAAARLVSHFQAYVYETMEEIARLSEIDGEPAAFSEISAALSLTRQAGEYETVFAMHLARQPRVLAALRDGTIDVRRAKVIMEGIEGASAETRTAALDRILPHVADLTTGQIRARLRRIVVELDPPAAVETYQRGLQHRAVVVDANPDGTANLHAYCLPPDRLNAIRQRLEELARSNKVEGDPRTADQLRADTLLEMLENSVSGGPRRACVNIEVDLTTLVGLSEAPGRIPGWGPVISEIARKVVDEQVRAGWEFTVTDQGRPIATGTVRRRPTTAMRRSLRSRYPTCVHPGCRRPAADSDIDHTKEWADGGPTTLSNLAPLCRYHHGLKDHGWSYRRRDDGTFQFTSPHGHTYVTSGQSP